MIELHQGDCLEVMAGMPDNSVDLIATDPPYFKVKNEPWDRQWDNPTAFLDWIGLLCEQWHRLLKPNGSLYVFASPKMAARVECKIGETFDVLNRITWRKHDGTENEGGLWSRANKDALRRYFEQKEEIIFAEHYGADGYAKGEAGYGAKCDELRGFVFGPLRAYLDSERERARLSVQDVAEAWRIKTGNKNRTGMAGHWFSQVQWMLPTEDNYQWLRDTFHSLNHGGEYLRREYEYLRREYEDLRREYEDLRREYEDLRRPFYATPERPYTDVWSFPTVAHFPGKHPCEKPVELMEHIVTTSSRPGAVVLDCFMGRGSTAIACQNTGRAFIGIDKLDHWVDATRRRIEHAQEQLALPVVG